MAGTAKPSYGTPNWEMLTRWLELPTENDAPFWALNLMKYRPVATYTDSDAPALSGKEADDAYAPLGPLAAVGAMVAFHGDVVEQRVGTPSWDRIGIVRYPSRAAFFAMQQRDDFKDQHVHKEAGMEFTIVMSCLPDDVGPSDENSDATLVLSVERGGTGGASLPPGVTLVAGFTVEGVIVGDDRTFDRARFVRAADEAAVTAIVAQASTAAEAHVMVVARGIDRLLDSITGPPNTRS
jgi:hypothetical protein